MGDVDLVAVVVLGFAGSGSPGPNNALILATALNHGFKRTLPHVAGAVIGVSALVVLSLAGDARLLESVDGAATALSVLGSVYLFYLAVRLATSAAAPGDRRAAPLNVREAALFQFLNPKAWLFATTVVVGALPHRAPSAAESILIVLTAAAVAASSFLIWAVGSSGLRPLVVSATVARGVNLVVAALLMGSIVLLWI